MTDKIEATEFECHMCGALLTDGVCKSCDHRQCEHCTVYSQKPTYQELEKQIAAFTTKTDKIEVPKDLECVGDLFPRRMRMRIDEEGFSTGALEACDSGDLITTVHAFGVAKDLLRRIAKAEAQVATIRATLAGRDGEIERLRDLCGCTYQYVGAEGGPVRFLDALSAASSGEPFSTEGLLPYAPPATNEAYRTETLLERDLKAQIERLKGDGWVSVEERLPEDGASVLVYTPKRHDDYISNRVAWIDYDSTPPRWIFAGEAIDDVAHWHPLPAPPIVRVASEQDGHHEV